MEVEEKLLNCKSLNDAPSTKLLFQSIRAFLIIYTFENASFTAVKAELSYIYFNSATVK